MSQGIVGSLLKDFLKNRNRLEPGEFQGDLIDDILSQDKGRAALAEAMMIPMRLPLKECRCIYCGRYFKKENRGESCQGCGAGLG